MKQRREPVPANTVAFVAEYPLKSSLHVGVAWSSALGVVAAKLGICGFTLPASSEV